MDFYARLGVPEVWVIDRDTRLPQLFRLVDGDYEELLDAADHWLRSPITGVWLRQGDSDKLEVQLGKDAASRQSLPLD